MCVCVCVIAEFQKIYDRLGVTIVERGESFYQPIMPGVVQDLEEKGKTLSNWHVYNMATSFFVSKFPGKGIPKQTVVVYIFLHHVLW